MAEREYIKVYSVNPERINENGELDPDAGLYPAFANQYGYGDVSEEDLPEKFGRPITYDNATNVHPTRKVHIHNKSGYGPRNILNGPDLKRGFSAIGYSGPDKNPYGDSPTTTFEGWHYPHLHRRKGESYEDFKKRQDGATHSIKAVDPMKDWQNVMWKYSLTPAEHAAESDPYLKNLDDRAKAEYSKAAEYEGSGDYESFSDTPAYRRGDYLSRMYVDRYNRLRDMNRNKLVSNNIDGKEARKYYYKDRLSHILHGRPFRIDMDERSGLLRIPVIVTADDEDVVNINDIINGNYDGSRDFQEEKQLKRILARRLPEGLFEQYTVDPKEAKKLQDILVRLCAALEPIVAEVKAVRDQTASFCERDPSVEECNAYLDKVQNFKYASLCVDLKKGPLKLVEELQNLNGDALGEGYADVIRHVDFAVTGALQDFEAHKYISKLDYENRLDDMMGPLFENYKSLNEALRLAKEHAYGEPYDGGNTFNPAIYDKLDNWFPYESETTGSDERIKNIKSMLSCEGCSDIKLHDNHVKFITDDFRKWLRCKDDRDAIISGIKELGQ